MSDHPAPDSSSSSADPEDKSASSGQSPKKVADGGFPSCDTTTDGLRIEGTTSPIAGDGLKGDLASTPSAFFDLPALNNHTNRQLTPDHTSTDSTTTASAWEAASSSSDQPASQCQSPSSSSATQQSGSNSSGTTCTSTAAQLGSNDASTGSDLDTAATAATTVASAIQVGQVYLTRRTDGTLHPAQVIQERTTEFGRSELYVHYVGLNRRLDQWVQRSRIMSLSPAAASEAGSPVGTGTTTPLSASSSSSADAAALTNSSGGGGGNKSPTAKRPHFPVVGITRLSSKYF